MLIKMLHDVNKMFLQSRPLNTYFYKAIGMDAI